MISASPSGVSHRSDPLVPVLRRNVIDRMTVVAGRVIDQDGDRPERLSDTSETRPVHYLRASDLFGLVGHLLGNSGH